MIAVDTNVLVYAHRREPKAHVAARDLVRGLAEGADAWAIAWPCVYEFFSVVTNVRIWKDRASTPDEAWAQIAAWLASPTLRMLAEPADFATTLESVVRRARVRGPVVHDARVAAICMAHGVRKLLTADRDFSLFPELAVENPFVIER